MFRKCVCALLMLVLCVGVALTDEFNAAITKVSDGKVTFTKFKIDKETKKFEKGKEETLPVAKDVKVYKGKFGKDKTVEAGDKIEGGLKSETFTKIGDKGVFAHIITDKDNKEITEIRAVSFGGKKGKDK